MTPDEIMRYARDIEAFADTQGWDQAPILLIFRGHNVDIALLEGHPSAVLEEVPHLGADALVLVTEGWTYPRHVTAQYDGPTPGLEALWHRQPPSEHPERIEVRNALAVTAEFASGVTRVRGGEPEDQDAVEGNLVDALRRHLA